LSWQDALFCSSVHTMLDSSLVMQDISAVEEKEEDDLDASRVNIDAQM
jgi:hypothetical protein